MSRNPLYHTNISTSPWPVRSEDLIAQHWEDHAPLTCTTSNEWSASRWPGLTLEEMEATPWRNKTRKGSGIWSHMPNQGFSAVLCIVVWFYFNSTLRLCCISKTVAIEIPTFLTVTNNELSGIHATQSLKLFVRRFTQLDCIRSWKGLPWIGWI